MESHQALTSMASTSSPRMFGVRCPSELEMVSTNPSLKDQVTSVSPRVISPTAEDGSEDLATLMEIKGHHVDVEIYRQIAKMLISNREDKTLSNEISASYEVPQYPIEQIETKLIRVKKEISKSVGTFKAYLGSIKDKESNQEEKTPLQEGSNPDDLEFVPQFQRVSISGDEDTGVAMNDLQIASKLLLKALDIRERYMRYSQQSFPTLVRDFLCQDKGNRIKEEDLYPHLKRESLEDYPVDPPKADQDPWECEFPEDCGFMFKQVSGVFHIFRSKDHKLIKYEFPNHEEFITDMHLMCALIANGPLKSFCYHRLIYLSSKFHLHLLFNELKELAAQKVVPHRDFYNVRKVDTHIHAASCMNQKHLLRFIKKALKTEPDTPVCQSKDRKPMTLKEVFQSMNLTAHDLTVDMLDVHADRNTFHRFDKFNAKYNPIGESRLREVFLKTDNYIGGRFFAKLIKEVAADLSESKYQNCELRLSIYGKSASEWDKLAEWAVNYNVYSDNVRWIIEVPRLYDIYKCHKLVNNFQVNNLLWLNFYDNTQTFIVMNGKIFKNNLTIWSHCSLVASFLLYVDKW